MFNFLPHVTQEMLLLNYISVMLCVEDLFQVSVLYHYLERGLSDLLFIFQFSLMKLLGKSNQINAC